MPHNSPLNIRQAEVVDLPAVGQLWAHYIAFHQQVGLAFTTDDNSPSAWASGFERTLGRFSFIWVAESEGQFLGFLAARIKRLPTYLGGSLVGEIADLWVEEAARGQGTASRLCESALDKMRELQVHSIEVQVLTGNPHAQRFWQSKGFQPELVQFRYNLGPLDHA